MSHSHACSNPKDESPNSQNNIFLQDMKTKRHQSLNSSLFCRTHFLFNSQPWNLDDQILESYAPESQHKSKDQKISFKSSRSLTRLSWHARCWHCPHRRRIEVSRWWWETYTVALEHHSHCQSAYASAASASSECSLVAPSHEVA